MLSKPNYLDPLRGRLPALERSIHKYRTLLMILVIYHAEELKHEVVQDVLTQERFRKLGKSKGPLKAIKWPEALKLFENEGILLPEERAEIAKLISFRNNIAHEIHKLFADLSRDRFTREIAEFETRKSTFDYDAANRLRDIRQTIKERQRDQHWVGVLSFRAAMFESADSIYREELKRLDKKIRKLADARHSELQALNKEFQLSGQWRGYYVPFSPHNHYDNNRLTARGVEICFRLFDEGKSPMAVAHLMRVTLNSVKRRHRQWQQLGGPNRPVVDFDALPIRKFYRRYDED